MAKRWFGFRNVGRAGFSSAPATSLDFTVSLNFTAISDGDTIVRTLFGWRVQTDLLDETISPSAIICPAFVALAYTPDPNGEPWGGAEAAGGAALCREMVSWEIDEWTDGSVHSRRWYANSYQLVSGEAQRTIHDKTTAELHLSFGFDHSMSGFDGVGIQANDANVMLWVEYLVLHA
jgi:hypothetical protein